MRGMLWPMLASFACAISTHAQSSLSYDPFDYGNLFNTPREQREAFAEINRAPDPVFGSPGQLLGLVVVLAVFAVAIWLFIRNEKPLETAPPNQEGEARETARQPAPAPPRASTTEQGGQRTSPTQKLTALVEAFGAASLAMPEVLREFDEREWTLQEATVAAAWIYGATDAMAQRLGLDQEATANAYFIVCFKLLGSVVSEDDLSKATAYACSHSDCIGIVQAGGQRCIDWFAGRNKTAPIGLARLLNAVRTE
jgi:hypothetical protein